MRAKHSIKAHTARNKTAHTANNITVNIRAHIAAFIAAFMLAALACGMVGMSEASALALGSDQDASTTKLAMASKTAAAAAKTTTAAGEAEISLDADSADYSDTAGDLSEDEQLYGYMRSHAADGSAAKMPKSAREWTLSGKNLTFYKAVKSLAQKVAAGKQKETITYIDGKDILGKTKFTASDLGLKVLATKSGGNWVLTSAARAKINRLLMPEDWTAVVTSATLDMPYELYWYNMYDASNSNVRVKWKGSITEDSITFDLSPDSTYSAILLPLISDYAQTSVSQYYLYEADTSKTGAVAKTAETARSIVSRHAAESDYDKLLSYMKEIGSLTSYDYDAAYIAENSGLAASTIYGDPWLLVSVFDGDPSTQTVCAGYGKAYKFLCDISSFKSRWIECHTLYGNIYEVVNGSPESHGEHLWCVVRMNNGLNYITDPTWYDGEKGVNTFLKGGKSGKDYYDVKTQLLEDSSKTVTLRYAYDKEMKSLFSASELTIAAADYDPSSATDAAVRMPVNKARATGIKDRTYTGKAIKGQHPVVKVDGRKLKEGTDYVITGYKNNVNVGRASFTIKGQGQYTGSRTFSFKILPKGTTVRSVSKGKKTFTVKWKRQSARMKKARITGYQIQYSTNSKFKSGNRTVTVKGFARSSQKITKLKARKKYYVRVRTYRKTGGATFYSTWSKSRSVVTN